MGSKPAEITAWTTPATTPTSTNISHRQVEPRRNFSEEDYDQHCCWGHLDVMRWLLFVAFINLLIDVFFTLLLLDYWTCYLFACASIISLLALCAAISGVQEERKRLVQISAILSALQFVVFTALLVTLAIDVYDRRIRAKDSGHKTTELDSLGESMVLAICLPPLTLTLLLHFFLARRVTALIKLRDDLYVIPSASGTHSVDYQRLRRSLQVHLESQWARRNRRAAPAKASGQFNKY